MNTLINLLKQIKEKSIITIYVKLNSKKTEIIKFDELKKAYIININAEPKNNKANMEIERFLAKLTKKKVKIVRGFKSKTKILKFY